MSDLSAGSRIAHYEILASLGAGGMAEVYRARDLTLGRQVALKILPAAALGNKDRELRFKHEATTVSALNHPNIVTIFEIGSDGDIIYIALELVDGKNVRQLLAGGPLPIATTLKIAAQIAEGLAKAHEAGVVHRDLKPENVMVTGDGLVKILDFGVAKIGGSAAAELEQFATATVAATRPGVVLGTAAYMSAEQARGALVDFRSDQFSLGLMLYEMVTAKHPFKRPTAVQTMAAIIDAPHEPLMSAAPTIPTPFGWIVDRCLSKRPDDRYGSTRDLARDLQQIATELSNPSGWSIKPPKPRARARASKRIDSIAVLPFANASGDADNDYLSDGITETMINSLSKIAGLKVMSRTTVFRYKDRSIDTQEVGVALRVRGIVTGRVQVKGDTMQVSAELVDVADGTQIWGNDYVRPLSDLMSLPQTLADDIASKLKLKSRGRRRAAGASKVPSPSSEAYQLYLRGRFSWNKRTPDEIKRGMEYLERATHEDPTFALAYAGLADCYSVLAAGEFAIFPPRQVMPKARAAAQRAVELDDSLAEAHCSLASVSFWFDWDWPLAERELTRALEINPGYAPAHAWLSEYLSATSRFDEALAAAKRATDLDPLSTSIMWSLARVYNLRGEFEEAIGEMQKSLQLEPQSLRPHYILAWAYYKTGQVEKAYDALERTIAAAGDTPFRKGFLGHIYAATGRTDDARRMVQEMNEQAKSRFVSNFYIGIVHAALGAIDEAFACMDRAFEERASYMAYFNVTPFLDALKGDPRFDQMVARLGLKR
ncbi:MAG TPA: protein kinase [Vicinamibacterales bacterium]|nr:protein kinase [Vicinamibacterales bacterium]